MKERLIANIFLLISVLFLPWWAFFLSVISFSFFINKFYEAIFFAFLMEVFIGPVIKAGSFLDYYVFTILVIVSVLFIDRMKKNLLIN